MRGIALVLLAALTLAVASVAGAQTVTLNMVPVGNPGNVADSALDSGMGSSTSPGTGAGEVDYNYSIDADDVTLGQYTAFLNAVAKTDPYGCYNSDMAGAGGLYPFGIGQTGSPGSYSYSVTGSNPQAANMPAFSVSWGDAARFCNWLQNGQPTSGTEGAGTTETGAYTLNGTLTYAASLTRNAGATWFIPTENEWYKAAYFDPLLNSGSGGYYTYATQSNTAPDNSLALAESESNDANYYISGYTDPTNYLTPVGTFTQSRSYYGTFDQSGDIYNWNETVVSGSSRGLRGGNWDYHAIYVSSSNRHYAGPPAEINLIGFRVASVPEPGSITLMLAAAGGLLIWRVRRK